MDENKKGKPRALSVAYQNVQLSISNTQAFLERGKQQGIDILFVAEGWVGKRSGQEVTDMITQGLPGG